jgi:mono/diheme cytochrome c family protein
MLVVPLLFSGLARAQDSAVKSIELPKYQPHLPAGAGRELFASACLSCHSTRYISMQPVVPVTKWEENVKKMIKTYGAPIAEDQAPALAQYLVAFQQAAPDELVRATQNPDRGVIPAGTPDAEKGKAVFAQACASCHGSEGKGDGPAMANLLPVATNLTAGHFTPRAVIRSMSVGVPGTAMPGFPTLTEEQIQNAAAYVVDLGSLEPKPAPADEAKTLFAQTCASCHGSEGKGDGFNAPTLARMPTNFHERQPSGEQALRAISDGVAGTAMPSWKAKLNDSQRKMLADYVRTFYAEAGVGP